jgi:hypothetical protein
MARKLLPPKPPKKRKIETVKKPIERPKVEAKPVEVEVEPEPVDPTPIESKVVEPPKPEPPRIGPSDAELAARSIMRQAETARQDFTAFYGFVMRHEITGKLLVPAPHQVVMFSFLKAHPMCVLRLPVGTSKTFSMAALSLWRLGRNTTRRMAIASGAQNQAKKVLAMVKDYITEPSLNSRLIAVFPKLVPSARATDGWTQTEITVDRPAGIRDPSMVAVGIDSKIAGSRLSDLIGDDLVDDQNTATPAARDHSQAVFDGRLLSRLDPVDSTATVTNTPWNPLDLTYHLEIDVGWPTITMDIYGNIRVCNEDASWIEEALETTLRVSTVRTGGGHEWYRLRAHDPDPREETPLWPERYPRDAIDRVRYGKDGESGMLPVQFARLFLCQPFSDTANRCHRDWIEKCKRKGMGMTLVDQYDGTNPTFTGLDPGIGKGKHNDKTVFFTYEVFEDGRKRILDIEGGRFSGPVIVKKTVEKHKRYKSMIAVETNQAQTYLKQFAEEARADLPIKRHDTLKNKYSIDFGVESIFTEIQRGAWIIPCDKNGRCHSEVQHWIDDCLYYQPPPAHTGDYLMASWIARETERRNLSRDPKPSVGKKRHMNQQLSIGGF